MVVIGVLLAKSDFGSVFHSILQKNCTVICEWYNVKNCPQTAKVGFLKTKLRKLSFQFLARDSIYAIARYMPSPVRPPVRLSVCPPVCHTGGSVKDG